jgi:hypothetical protein
MHQAFASKHQTGDSQTRDPTVQLAIDNRTEERIEHRDGQFGPRNQRDQLGSRLCIVSDEANIRVTGNPSLVVAVFKAIDSESPVK